MEQKYIEISDELFKQAYENARSKENMVAFGAADKRTEYMGSRVIYKDYIFDFYQDADGGWWYGTSVGVNGKGIVGMEEYIFKKGIGNDRRR